MWNVKKVLNLLESISLMCNVKKCKVFKSHAKSTHHSPDISWHLVSNNVMQPSYPWECTFYCLFTTIFSAVKYNQNRAGIIWRNIQIGNHLQDYFYSWHTAYSDRNFQCVALHIPANALFIAFLVKVKYNQNQTGIIWRNIQIENHLQLTYSLHHMCSHSYPYECTFYCLFGRSHIQSESNGNYLTQYSDWKPPTADV